MSVEFAPSAAAELKPPPKLERSGMIGGVHPVRKDVETAGGGGEGESATGAGGGGTAAAGGGGDGGALVVGVLGSVLLYRRVEIEERREKGDWKAWLRGKDCRQPRPASRRRSKNV